MPSGTAERMHFDAGSDSAIVSGLIDRTPGQGTSQASEVGQTGASTGMAYMYRITARATGGNPNIVRVVETTFAATVLESCGLS